MLYRSKSKTNFTWVHNTFIRDKRLSIAEIGMLLLLISLPADWSFSIAGIQAMVADGRDKVSSTLKALEKHGYLKRVQRHDDNGVFVDLVYMFSDEPIFLENNDITEDDFTQIGSENAVESPVTGNPHVDSPNPENPSNNNDYNKELLIYESLTKETLCCAAAQPAPEKTKSTDKKAEETAVYEEIIAHFNSKAHTHFKPTTKHTRELIDRWINEGCDADDFRTVIDRKTAQWMGTKMQKFLRPVTLFGDNFESYLNEPEDYGGNSSPKDKEKPKDYSTDMIDLLHDYLGV